MDLTFEYMRGLSEIFGGASSALGSMAPTQEMDSGAGTLVMEGEAGSTVKASFLVSNDLDRALTCQLVGSSFTDPSGASLPVHMVFEPAALKLAAGEQKVVSVTVTVDERLAPGVGYAGEIAVGGMDGFAVPVVLRRQTTVDASSSDTPAVELNDFADAASPANNVGIGAPRAKRSDAEGGTRNARKRKSKRRQ
ncbi:MAG: hypothetical protein U0132_04320 [Gemmatimonadaceae bacterium]